MIMEKIQIIQGDPEKIGISVFFNVFCTFFWVTVNYTIQIGNCLYLEDFLKSIEHNRKIRNSKFFFRKKVCETKNVQQLHLCALTIFYGLLIKEF